MQSFLKGCSLLIEIQEANSPKYLSSLSTNGKRVQIPLPFPILPLFDHVILVKLSTLLLKRILSLMSLFHMVHTIKIIFNNINNNFFLKTKSLLSVLQNNRRAMSTMPLSFTNAPLTVRYYNPTTPIIYYNIFKINLNIVSNI